MTSQMCQKWFAKFHAGDFSLNDAPRLGRPVDSDQIETLIENVFNQHYTMWERADILKNIQLNKVIGENEKYIIYFIEKKMNFLSNPILQKFIRQTTGFFSQI